MSPFNYVWPAISVTKHVLNRLRVVPLFPPLIVWRAVSSRSPRAPLPGASGRFRALPGVCVANTINGSEEKGRLLARYDMM